MCKNLKSFFHEEIIKVNVKELKKAAGNSDGLLIGNNYAKLSRYGKNLHSARLIVEPWSVFLTSILRYMPFMLST